MVYFRDKNYGEIILNISISFICNNELINTSLHPATTVLDFVRKHLHLTGTKEACREGDCGACTILVGELKEDSVIYRPVNSCLLPLGSINGKHIVTIEGINQKELNLIQELILYEGGTQCGFCTPGFIMSMTGYFINSENYKVEDLLTSLDGNICRCTGYASIKRASFKIINEIKNNGTVKEHGVAFLVNKGLLPEYFLQIPEKLKIMADQEYNLPDEGNGNATYVAGGTDLFVQNWERLSESSVRFISNLKNLPMIWSEENLCFINAGATISDLQNSKLIMKYFPEIKNYFNYFGSLPIRNNATIGGNIINASPIGDSTIFFMAMNTKLYLSDGKSIREVLLKDFYKGYKNIDKRNEEILDYLSFSIPKANGYFNFEKVSRRTYLDIASVNSAIYLELKDDVIHHINISAGGVSPVPMLLEKTSEFLITKEIKTKNIRDAALIAQAEISPISDVRGSVEYKSILLRQIIFSHFLKLFPEKIQAEELV